MHWNKELCKKEGGGTCIDRKLFNIVTKQHHYEAKGWNVLMWNSWQLLGYASVGYVQGIPGSRVWERVTDIREKWDSREPNSILVVNV